MQSASSSEPQQILTYMITSSLVLLRKRKEENTKYFVSIYFQSEIRF